MGVEKYKDRWNFIPDATFEEYKERFKDYFSMKRKNGIIEVRMHKKGLPEQPAIWSFELHRALPQMFQAVGADRDNEVMILTGTGDFWLHEFDQESFDKEENDPEVFRATNYDLWYYDGIRLQEHLLWNIAIPVIAVINGPGFHLEFALLADLTLCAEDTKFFEAHITIGTVPGDGLELVFQELLGMKRTNQMVWMYDQVSAQQALEWGMVNYVLPREKLLPRAWEIAEHIMKTDRVTRNLTTQVLRRPWKRLFTNDFEMHYMAQGFAVNINRQKHMDTPIEDVVDQKGEFKNLKDIKK